MAAMDEVELSPLLRRQRPQAEVRGKLLRSEQAFARIELRIHPAQLFFENLCQGITIHGRDRLFSRKNEFRGRNPAREMAECNNDCPLCNLTQGWLPGRRRSTPPVFLYLNNGVAIGEHQMLDHVVRGPRMISARRMNLAPFTAQAVQPGAKCICQFLEMRVHGS